MRVIAEARQRLGVSPLVVSHDVRCWCQVIRFKFELVAGMIFVAKKNELQTTKKYLSHPQVAGKASMSSQGGVFV